MPGLLLVRDGWSLIAGQIGSRFLEIEDSRLKVMVRFIRSIERNLLEVVQDVGFEGGVYGM